LTKRTFTWSQAGLIFAARITFSHFSVSSARSLPNSRDEPASIVPPNRNARPNFGSPSAALISVWSFVDNFRKRVFRSADTEQRNCLVPGTKSLMSEFRNASERVIVVTANARNLPFLMYSTDPPIPFKEICTCPASRSSVPDRRRGKARDQIDAAIILSHSPATWPMLPLPTEAC